MRPSNVRAVHAALSGWLVGLLAVGPAAAQTPVSSRLVPRALSAATAEAPADAASVTVVAIALDAAARGDAARLAREAELAVTRSGRLKLVRLSDALDADGQRERQVRDAEAAEAMKAGQRAYDELDTEKALEHFDKAVRGYEGADLSQRFTELSRARVMKAASQVANGENTAAQLEIRTALALNPEARFSPNFFPPEEMTFVEKERKAVLTGPKSSLRVSTEPVPAQVFVDGQFRGISPVDVADLTAADHYVTVVAPGYALTQRREREGEVSLSLAPVAAQKGLQTFTEQAARKPESPERDAALRELGTLAGVSQVLALLVRGGAGTAPLEVTGLRLDVSDGHNQAYALGTVPRGDGLVDGSQALLAQLVSADAPRQGGKPVTHFAGGVSNTRRTVGYVLMATGVALLAGGVYFGMEASAKSDDFKRAAQNSSRAQDLKSTGKSYALVADVGILLGLASAGAGGYLAFANGGGSKSTSRASRPAPSPVPAAAPQDTPPAPKEAPAAEKEPLPMPPPAQTAPASKQKEPSTSNKRAQEDEARQREEELRKRREEVERQRKELEERRKQEEAAAQREQEERRQEERRRQEEKKKRPALDDDDLRNY
ncbi:PEGA domain-containing protein [Myxococcus xanthus]|uniref:PEGA domain-containing protein n=1 Tax=Myxococcus xanthus TaxID=34 RepID=A0A7Y4MQ70_MYXXA|nr:PEGA domain-containing protein [Myxococcus xanthus]NOJ78596.1 PEGA domain-containing protein [Myxococcus xanthus]NOJ86436.1 PEGA domain-containing protein [Myxococcus xanthus]